MRKTAALFALALAVLAARAGRADQAPAGDGAAYVDPESPRAALESYLDAARNEDYEQAAAYLELPAAEASNKTQLAQRLKFVLERHGIDLEALSPAAEGDTGDGLPAGVDRIASVGSERGKADGVFLHRIADGTDGRWVFSRDTVRRVDAWYAGLEERWLLDRLPDFLLRSGPFDLLWWQWGALLVVLLVGWLAGTVLGRFTIGILTRLAARTPPKWDDALIARKRGPITLLWTAAACWALLPAIDLYPAADGTLKTILRLTVYVALFWALARAADVLAANATNSEWAKRNHASRSLIPLGSRLLKLGVLAAAVVGLLAQLGYPVASLIAGFGIGGLALALAAQKTIENLFGALSLAVDQPLREGDLVRVDDRVGTVETIGLRSTRIRSPARTLITIPNGKVAEMTIESLAARDRILFECKIGLVYDTSAEQLRKVLRDLKRILRSHEHIWPDSIDVHFTGYGASSLDVEVMAWFQTTDFSQFLALRQEILLEFMQAIAAAGSALALPAQTLHVAAGSRSRARVEASAKHRDPPS